MAYIRKNVEQERFEAFARGYGECIAEVETKLAGGLSGAEILTELKKYLAKYWADYEHSERFQAEIARINKKG